MLKILFWMNIPSHHQSAFFYALRAAGLDVCVCYYARKDDAIYDQRLALGWKEHRALPTGEYFVRDITEAFNVIRDWRQRIHIIPGCGSRFLRKLIIYLSRCNVQWVHWSERARGGVRWFLSYPLKLWYARTVNHSALGAFAIGNMAIEDFVLWGINRDRIAFLPYSINGGNLEIGIDSVCKDFCSGRPAFIFVGNLCQRKATDILIKAFARVSRMHKEWILILVGNDSSNGAYVQLAEQKGVRDKVLFRGIVDADKVFSCYRAAKIAILPSRFDGWGVVMNEAASMGIALVASEKVGAAHHLICSGVNGYNVKSGSTDSLSKVMLKYMNDPELYVKHGEQSLQVYEGFTPRVNADRFIMTINTWLGSNQQKEPHCNL